MSSETLRWLILFVKPCFVFLFLRHVCGLWSSSADESLKGNCRTLWYPSKPLEIFQYLHHFAFYIEWIIMIMQDSSVTTGTSLWAQQLRLYSEYGKEMFLQNVQKSSGPHPFSCSGCHPSSCSGPHPSSCSGPHPSSCSGPHPSCSVGTGDSFLGGKSVNVLS